jgi:hypothetical protein
VSAVTVTVHFAGGDPLVIRDVPRDQAEEFRSSIAEDPTVWRGLSTDEGLRVTLNRDQITWVEFTEPAAKPDQP